MTIRVAVCVARRPCRLLLLRRPSLRWHGLLRRYCGSSSSSNSSSRDVTNEPSKIILSVVFVNHVFDADKFVLFSPATVKSSQLKPGKLAES